jgi:DNA-binding NtrC family response regulator
VRELRNVVERAILTGGGRGVRRGPRLGPGQPPGRGGRVAPPAPGGPHSIQESIEKRYIGDALRLAGGNETKAAQLLNVNYHTFRYRRKKFGL